MNKLFLSLLVISAGIGSVFLLADVAQNATVNAAKVDIHGLSAGSPITGEARFEENDKGVHITAKVSKVTPAGKHGFHIHEFGDVSNEGKAAGDHFNPDKHEHGNVMTQGLQKVHAGDLGNITIDEQGNGTLDVFVPGLTISEGKFSIAGRAIILHEKEDNFGQPTGNAGSRIGGGTIYIIAK